MSLCPLGHTNFVDPDHTPSNRPHVLPLPRGLDSDLAQGTRWEGCSRGAGALVAEGVPHPASLPTPASPEGREWEGLAPRALGLDPAGPGRAWGWTRKLLSGQIIDGLGAAAAAGRLGALSETAPDNDHMHCLKGQAPPGPTPLPRRPLQWPLHHSRPGSCRLPGRGGRYSPPMEGKRACLGHGLHAHPSRQKCLRAPRAVG